MLPVVILLTIIIVAISGITTIPFSIGLLAVSTVLFKKSWVFFLALGLGLFLDVISVRPLGYASLVLVAFVFLIRLYERKFEIQTTTFIFISSFLGSLFYLWLFGYQTVLLQAFITALISAIFFRVILNWFQDSVSDEMLK